MATLDIFNQNPFTMVELSTTVSRQPYVPQYLGGLPMWATKSIRTKIAAIEEWNGSLALIQTDERAAPPNKVDKDKRKVHFMEPPRLSQSDTIYAAEIQDIRAYGSETELKQVAQEVQVRQEKMRNQLILTHEYHRLGAVQGIVLDAPDENGNTATIVNWFTQFGITQDDEINFDLDDATPESGEVHNKCTQVVRQTLRGLGMPMAPMNMQIIGLCGDTFFDQLTAHPEIRATYLNQIEARQLREGNAFGVLQYGGITFINYRSYDDGQGTADETIGIAATKCKFFPVVAGLFERIFAPGEWFPVINIPGLEFYNLIVPDLKRQAFVMAEMYTYHLYVCTRPKALQRGINT